MSDAMFVNGLPLPAALVEAMRSDVWQTPNHRETWRALFPDNEIVQPMLYKFKSANSNDPWLSQAGPAYYGNTSEGFIPGTIDPKLAVLIADLGPDRLIALDYRDSLTRPSVIALTSSDHGCWCRVADDIESFMRALGIFEGSQEPS
jgi:hypothetical protein